MTLNPGIGLMSVSHCSGFSIGSQLLPLLFIRVFSPALIRHSDTGSMIP